MKVKCLICGAIFEDTLDNCPICGVGREFFEPVLEEDKVEKTNNKNYNVLIIGGGIAALEAALEIRKNNSEADITIFYDEFYLPYNRTLLTKKLFQIDDKIVLHDYSFYESKKIKLVNEEVTSVDTSKKNIFTKSNTYSYDYLVIATGSKAQKLKIKGQELEGVFTLRNILDAKKIITYLNNKKEIVIIGAGILGLEAGISFLNAKKSVTFLEYSSRLLQRQLDIEGSNYLLKKLTEQGLKFIFNANIKEIEENLVIKYNETNSIKAEMILMSVGILKNDKIIDSLTVDENLKTKYDGVYACGDVVSKYGLWQEATKMGNVVGYNITNENKKKYLSDQIYFLSKLNDLNILSLGEITSNYIDLSDENIYLKYYFDSNDKLIGANLISKENKLDEILKMYLNRINKSELNN